jgi:hypothetical protein
LYLLRNPARAGIVQLPEAYTWSSAKYYYPRDDVNIVDTDFVKALFGSKDEFLSSLHVPLAKELPVVVTKYGEVMGSENFLKSALKKHDRRKIPITQSVGVGKPGRCVGMCEFYPIGELPCPAPILTSFS